MARFLLANVAAELLAIMLLTEICLSLQLDKLSFIWGFFLAETDVMYFLDISGCLPHRYKIVIAGNHDLGFDDSEDLNLRGMSYRGRGTPQGYKLLTNSSFDEIGMIGKQLSVVYGIRIYGSSWHPLPGYSFSRERGQPLLDKWNLIPEGIDVLVTHSPPLGHSDNFKGTRWGCSELLNTVEYRVKPLFHVFGH
uniref:Calcineurin-like phosphoesterase domain-containing protein n=1 Tax=Parascaris equorum TaxID=6256 RepID=A0A914RIK1_PAREQ